MAAAHEFALYVENIPGGTQWRITDSGIIHRMRTVLRARSDDTVVFFSAREQARAVVKSISDREIIVTLADRAPVLPLTPLIDLILPFLERAACEEAISAATVLGVHRIVLVRTQKSAPSLLSPSFKERLHRIMVAAAEQSKQYCLPEISEAATLAMALPPDATAVFFHPTGSPLTAVLPVLEKAARIAVIVGPAGDLTADERDALAHKGACFLRLTPTVLRSEAAVMVGIGVLRTALQPMPL